MELEARHLDLGVASAELGLAFLGGRREPLDLSPLELAPADELEVPV